MDLIKILNEVLKRGFPELMDEDIQIKYNNLSDACFEIRPLSPEGYHIDVDAFLKHTRKNILIGGIAHELCHIVDKYDSKFLYKFSKKFRIYQERNTDLQVVIRGFGVELLDFLWFCENSGYPRYVEDGLSIVELEKILGRI